MTPETAIYYASSFFYSDVQIYTSDKLTRLELAKLILARETPKIHSKMKT
jgi:hypothetical protein